MENVLEIGCGTGHLQTQLQTYSPRAYGIDASPQMCRITRKHLLVSNQKVNICRAVSQSIPFPSGQFSGVFSTFPSEYLFEANTILELSRVTEKDGLIVVVLYVKISTARFVDRMADWLFRITRQSGEGFSPDIKLWEDAGVEVHLDEVALDRGTVVRLIGRKSNAHAGNL